ncbi:MAG: DNA translocase FtsK 4TM domain-containing protein, partial [Sphingomonadaceae bacterium]
MAAAAASGLRVWPRLRGLAVLGLGAGLAAALAGYVPGDPSLNVAAPGPVANPLGAAGAVSADLLLQALGLAALVPVAILLAQGGRLLAGGAITRPRWRLLAGLAATLLAALALALGVAPGLLAQLPAGAGGALGQGLAGAAGRALALLPAAPALDPAAIAAGLAGLLALGLTLFAGGLRRGDLRAVAPARGADSVDASASSRPAASPPSAPRGAAGTAAAAEPSRPARITAAAPRREQLPLPLDREGG